jgi:tetratricopeptide (TPR) repeat protein
MVGIFVVVGVLLWILMVPTWTVDWHTFKKTSLIQKGKYKEALPHLLWLYNHHPGGDALSDTTKNPTFLGELGHCYKELHQFDEAVKYLRSAQENASNLPPDDQNNPREPTDFSTDLGDTLFRAGKLDEAEKVLTGALKKNKVDKVANFALGELEFQRGNYRKAADYFKVVAREPAYQDKVKKYYGEIEKRLFGNNG